LDDFTDPKFVTKLIAGDSSAFAILCAALVRKLPEFIVRSSGLNYSDAEEVASEVLFKVHGSIKTFRPRTGTKVTTWIFEIAKHAAIDRRRRLKSQNQMCIAEEEIEGNQSNSSQDRHQRIKTPSQYETAMMGDAEVLVGPRILPYKEAFEQLSERERDILRMRQVLDYAEISAVEGEDIGALRTRHSRARKHLQDISNSPRGKRNE
jgi:RNA polymerase sigma factor (sigma-70 family)